jgi:polysaccharide chain length determinant protein (PEP-CTERM system associated)
MLKIGWRRKWQIVLPAIVVAAAAAWWIHRLPDRYRSDALLMFVPQRIPETFVRSTVTSRGDSRLQAITQQILSRTQLEPIILEFDLYAGHRDTASMQDLVERMRTRDIEIRPVKGDAFRLGFISERPELARQVVERLVSLFIVKTSLDRATIAESADQFLETQLEGLRRKLIENESKLAEYRRRHNGELPTQLEANVRGLQNAELQLQMLADSLNRDRDRRLMLERSIKDANLELIEVRSRGVTGDASTVTAAEQLERAEAALQELQSTLTERHPDLVALKQTIADLRKRADTERARPVESAEATAADRRRTSRLEELEAELAAVERQIAQKTTEEERLRGTLANYQQRIEGAPTREADFAALTRDYETLQQTYRSLLTKKQESGIAANLERQDTDAHFNVLDPPRLPEQPFAPNRMLLSLIGVLAGLAIGLIFAVILEWFDRGLRTQDDVRLALGLPVLATIPLASPRPRGVRRAATFVSLGAVICAGVAAVAWQLLK